MRKKANRQSADIDGVVQRQRRREIGNFKNVQPMSTDEAPVRPSRQPNTSLNQSADEEVEIITEEDIIENTRSEIDTDKIGKGSWWKRHKAKRLAKKQKWARKPMPMRVLRNGARIFMAMGLVYGVYFAVITFSALNGIIDRGGDGALALQENIQPSALRGEGDGRINIMLLGIGGEKHIAGNLADSIIVASIDPFANEAAMLSVPRDMYVDIPGYGSTRINAAHAYGEDDPSYEGGGIELMKQTLEETLDINIHYYVRIDFTGFVEAIDTIGGVTIDLEEPVYDPNFDWEFGANALNLPAGENTLDGQTALLLARARGASGIGLGVERGDFGRADRQRDILLAAKDKVLSAGTYANPVKLSELIRTAGSHVRTDIQIGEMLRMYEIAEAIQSDRVISFGLDNSPDNYLQSANIGGASVQIPKAGDYSEIQLFVRELFIDGFIKQEAPVLDVYNGTVVAGMASEAATELESYGYELFNVDNAPTQNYSKTIVYDLSGGEKPFTKQLIENRFGVQMVSGTQLPPQLKETDSDFVIILGSDYLDEEATF